MRARLAQLYTRLRRALDKDANRGRMLDSAAWTLGERVFALGITFVVSVVVANYLGAAQFGRLSYAIALVTLFSTLMTAGLTGVVVRDLVRRPVERYEILGTVLLVRLVASLAVVVLLLGATFVLGAQGAANRLLVAIIALGLCFRAADAIDFWFQSQTRLRYVSIANLAAAIVGNASRVLLVVAGGTLTQFAWVIVVEQVVTSLVLAVTYQRTVGPLRVWTFDGGRARRYLREAFPLMLSGVANNVNLRADQVMLGTILGPAAVGVYGVAARLSEVWYFIPSALGNVVFPTIIRAQTEGEQQYRRVLRRLYGLFIWGGIGVAVPVSLLGGPLIELLFSEEFAGAAGVLAIHAWSAPFLFMGVILSKWLIVEGLLYSSMVRHGFGAALNIGLNLVLIPAHGPQGAAVASLISYAAATYGACLLTPRTRPAAIDMTLGFLAPVSFCFNALRARRAAE